MDRDERHFAASSTICEALDAVNGAGFVPVGHDALAVVVAGPIVHVLNRSRLHGFQVSSVFVHDAPIHRVGVLLVLVDEAVNFHDRHGGVAFGVMDAQVPRGARYGGDQVAGLQRHALRHHASV